MRNKILTIILFAAVSLTGGYLFAMLADKDSTKLEIVRQDKLQATASDDVKTKSEAPVEKSLPVQPVAPKVEIAIKETVKFSVPFVVQAPFGNWSDPVFQNACEEASIIMAMAWVNGTKTIPPEQAKKQILDIVNFENKTFGYNADTDVSDVQKIFQKYFNYQKTSVKENITISDIKNELQQGNLVIIPALGQSLGNPNYTPPGPIVHMLVIVGYDPGTREFITNDPGTRMGSGHRYGENVLFDAIWDYPSGKTTPQIPAGVLKKDMLVVSKN